MKSLNHVRLFVIPWTVAYPASPSMGFSRQEYWSELPFPPPGDLPDPGIEPKSPESPALHVDAFPTELWNSPINHVVVGNLFILSVFHFPNLCAVCLKSLQLCPSLYDPMEYSPPGSPVHRILWARILEWVDISFPRGSPQPWNIPRTDGLQLFTFIDMNITHLQKKTHTI